MDEQAAGRLAADINRNYFSIERSRGRFTRYRAMAVVSRPAPDGDRDFGVRVSDQREDEFTLWDDADVQEAKALARSRRANRYGLYSAVLARLLLLVFASRAIFELVNGNVITAIVVALAAAASVWYADWACRRWRPRGEDPFAAVAPKHPPEQTGGPAGLP
ncbi:MAG TPA: hypothetical protein VKF14_09970 [Candidatus Dormibacteraeota bacterium]|nr:hypothetical protein [Candidatus Dormibacteraeota bacterium]